MSIIDGKTKAQVTMRTVHNMVHAGKMFTASRFFTTVGASVSAELVINITGTANEVHLYPEVASSGGPCRVYLYEDHTQTAAGTAIQARNMNRCDGVDTATAVITYTPTAATTGAATVTIGMKYLTAAGVLGVSVRADDEYILAPGSKYLLRAENNTAGNVNMFINLEWYELLD